MFVVRDKVLEGRDKEILNGIRDLALQTTGKNLMNKMREVGDNIQFTCPFHKDGMESKPSCGVSTKTIHRGGDKVQAGTVHCFTCGYTASLDKMISDLMFVEDGGESGYKWLKENFDLLETRQMTLDFTRNRNKVIQYIDEDILETYRFNHPYMFTRGLNDDLIEKYDIGYDKYTDCITFPVKDIKGRCLFVARRHTKKKWFNYPTGAEKPLYGIYEMNHKEKELYICESFLDAITCNKYGKEAIALMGTGDFKQYEEINKLSQRVLILALDGDSAGKKGIQKLCRYIRRDKLVYILELPENKDINDLTEDEFNKLPKTLRTF